MTERVRCMFCHEWNGYIRTTLPLCDDCRDWLDAHPADYRIQMRRNRELHHR